MNNIFITLILSLALNAFSDSDKPANVPVPKGTIPYNKNLCKTRQGEQAFSFVKIQPKFDKNGCTQPVKAWSYNEKKDQWKAIQPKHVTCCDPSAEAGSAP